jgi:hypothetical protein
MFNVKDAGRLFQEDWKSPGELARQLYQMVTSKETKTVNAPVEISVPKGQTALRISQAKAEPSPSSSSPSIRNARITQAVAAQAKFKPVLQAADGPGQSRNPGSLTPDEIRPQASGIDHASSVRTSDHAGDFRPQSTSTADRQQRSFQQPAAIKSGSQVQTGPKGLSSRADQPAQQSRFAKSYQNPVFEVAEGEVKFSGNSPVQFDRQPYVFNTNTDSYEPMGKVDGSTAQPAFAEGAQVWGKVTGGTGPTQMVTLYDDPAGSPAGETISCTFPGLDPTEQIPPGTWVYPIFVNGDGAYFCVIPVWLS